MAPHKALFLLASPADVLSGSSRVPAPLTTLVGRERERGNVVGTSAWEANFMAPRILTIYVYDFAVTIYTHEEMRSHTVFY